MKYHLKIPFKLNDNSSIKNKDENIPFKLDKYTIKINLKENNQKGYFCIKYFEQKSEIWEFYQNFKKTIEYLNLSPLIWSIKVKPLDKENISEYIFEEKPSLKNSDNNTFICKTSEKILMNESFKMGIVQLYPEENIIKEISKNYEKLKHKNWDDNKKIIVAMDIYTNSYFKEKTTRFLSFINILELLKPEIKRKGLGLKCVNKLKSYVEQYRTSDQVQYNENLKNEFEGIFNSVKQLEKMSITYSIKQMPAQYKINIEKYDNMPKILSECYNVRSKFAHEGEIIDTFDECFNFLTEFIPILIINAIENMDNK